MANTDLSVHKLEMAVDLVTDVDKMSRQARSSEPSTTSSKISPKQVKDMMLTFNLFDRNHDKSLDLKEVASVFRALGQNPTENQLRSFINEVDRNKNGKLEEDEYVELLMKHMQSKEEVEQELQQAFRVFDRNADGKIDKHELMAVLRTCGDPLTSSEADDLINKMDKNKDGLIDVQEFTSFLCGGYPTMHSEQMPAKPTTKR